MAVFRELRRVLRDDGTVWLNYGDAYWGGQGDEADYGQGLRRAGNVESGWAARADARFGCRTKP